jgi:pseudaminic acid biosynthesis-associated methylase
MKGNKMTDQFKTEQEAFWAGGFGDNYIDRNQARKLLSANISFFSNIFQQTQGVTSILEFGANIGMNMIAMEALLPEVELSAVEINETAYAELAKKEYVTAHNCSILDFEPKGKYDFVFTKGVLIHINPAELDTVYQKMYAASSRYLCVGEYYNPTPVAIPYRGHNDRLFKRDFAGDLLEKFSDLQLVDYRFVYHRDNRFPQDDITWFLLEKK